MNKTSIEWALNPDGSPGYTWNPITGCLNGCEYCYAKKLANTRLKDRYLANKNLMPSMTNLPQSMGYELADPFYPRIWPERFKPWELQARKKPMGIFTCDMSDLFGIGIPENWTTNVLNVARACPQHRFYLLTKQPQNLAKFSPFPQNVWVGASATSFKMFVDALAYLSSVKAGVKYLSLEPLLSWDRVITNDYAYSVALKHAFNDDQLLRDAGISWVIIGAQTKPYKPPQLEWVEEIVNAADKADIPVFLKNNLMDAIPACTLPFWVPDGEASAGMYYRQYVPEVN